MKLFALVFFSGCSKKQAGIDVVITDDTPVHIKYDVGGKNPGTLDIIYKGKNVKMLVVMSKDGQSMNVNLYIKDNFMYYVIEGDTNGIKSNISNNEFYKTFGIIFNVKDKLTGFEKTGSEDILGYKCDSYKTKEGDLLSVYNERTLFKNISKDVSMTAISFEANVKITDDIFEIPKNVNFVDMDKMHNMDNMKDMHGMNDMMK